MMLLADDPPIIINESGARPEGEIEVYNFLRMGVSTMPEPDGLKWIADELCHILEIQYPQRVYARLRPNQKGVRIIPTPGGPQRKIVVIESGMWDIVLESRKPRAKEFMVPLRRHVEQPLTSSHEPGVKSRGGVLAFPE